MWIGPEYRVSLQSTSITLYLIQWHNSTFSTKYSPMAPNLFQPLYGGSSRVKLVIKRPLPYLMTELCIIYKIWLSCKHFQERSLLFQYNPLLFILSNMTVLLNIWFWCSYSFVSLVVLEMLKFQIVSKFSRKTSFTTHSYTYLCQKSSQTCYHCRSCKLENMVKNISYKVKNIWFMFYYFILKVIG